MPAAAITVAGCGRAKFLHEPASGDVVAQHRDVEAADAR